MTRTTVARARFRALLQQPEPQLDLAEAALCIAWEDQGAGDPEAGLCELNTLAYQARLRLAGVVGSVERITVLNRFLFDELGFHGNTDNYSDPANSFLDRVLTTRTGLPITLSVVYIEVGRRLGLPIHGLALPGHFLTRYADGDTEIVIDPFNRGRIWSRVECERQIVAAFGAQAGVVMERVMAPPTKRAILARMLRNLKNSYVEAGDFGRALAAVERILLIEPHETYEVRDRGLIRAHLGLAHLALDDLDWYARMAPRAPDLDALRPRARALAEQITPQN
jgi:regulator of sirC expression with transglutaminase-like and TPR domain